ncbi:hypothetical protein [Clostridium sporogenes]|uniref:hypothetical protein n=1 Tax=Clostridium sporogenes TaxID=1509 RepID=UPI0022390F17|nr:hypothetical protein [Clostridium sporogenes]MCW6078101.1 hypothetical protein [Clostridium sporogenes]
MEYTDVVKIVKYGLENMKSIQYDKSKFLEEYIISIYFDGDVLPNLKSFMDETEFMGANHGLEELIVSVGGITVNKLFISFKHIKNVKFDMQTINIMLQIT